ncbi:MAG: hypothetical protein HQ538_02375 [Parcubacteria group bacterium]|nr:hypothetical protein [Parcubacteria group bacterium]
MSKIKIIISFLIICLLLSGGYYWWVGTPQYSVSQIKKAIKTHNMELGIKYIDTDAIFNNFWTDIKEETIDEIPEADEFEGFGMMLGLQMIENMKPVMEERFKQGIESWFLAPTGESQEIINTKENFETGTFWQKDLKIEKQGNSTYIELPDNVKIVLTKKEKERYWVISKIEGFTEVFSNDGNIGQDSKKEGMAFINKLREKIDVEVIDKGFISSDWERGIYEDQITIKLKFINKTNKDINGVQGKIIFYDIFNDEIHRIKISYDKSILANESEIWGAAIEYNQFRDDDKKLKTTELENLKYEWMPEEIIYQDGTKENNN